VIIANPADVNIGDFERDDKLEKRRFGRTRNNVKNAIDLSCSNPYS
jgi:hypothetical protein